jgi:hypothetical protein
MAVFLEISDPLTLVKVRSQPTERILANKVDLVLGHIAMQEGISEERLYLINQHKREYPELNRAFLYVKAIDGQTHQIYEAMMDWKDNQFVDIGAIEKENGECIYKKYGKLEPQLFDLLQAKTSEEEINVAIWFVSGAQQSNILEQIRTNYSQVPQNAVERPWLMVKNDDSAGAVREIYLRLTEQSNLAQQESLGQWLANKDIKSGITQVSLPW